MSDPLGGPEGAASGPWDESRVEALGGAFIAAANAAGIGLSLVRFEGREPIVVYMTDVGAQILGHPMKEILSRSAMAFMAADERQQRTAHQEARMRGDPPPRTFETIAVTAEGRRVPIEVSVAQIQYPDQPLLVTFFRDISERRRSLDALQRSEERFRKLIELTPDAVWINDGRRLLYANPGTAKMLGYGGVDEVLALDPREFVHPDDVQAMGARTQQMFASGEALPPRDYRVRRSDGSWALTEVQSIPLEWEGQRAILGFARDVTARRQMETQLIRNERLAALGTLLAGIAHEMNSPLGYVLLGVEHAFRELEAVDCAPAALSRVKEVLLDVRQGVERVAAVVRQLRASSRPEASEREPVDLRQVLESALRVVQNEIRHRAQLIDQFCRRSAGHGQRPAPGTGLPQPAGERHPGVARGATREPHPGQPGHHRRRRRRGGGGGQRSGHRRRRDGPRLRSLLHHQGGRHRDGPGPVDLPRHRHLARGQHRRGERARRGQHLQGGPAAGQRRGGGPRQQAPPPRRRSWIRRYASGCWWWTTIPPWRRSSGACCAIDSTFRWSPTPARRCSPSATPIPLTTSSCAT